MNWCKNSAKKTTQYNVGGDIDEILLKTINHRQVFGDIKRASKTRRYLKNADIINDINLLLLRSIFAHTLLKS